MPVPKRKKAKQRTRSRKAQWFAEATEAPKGICPQCKKAKLPHRACPTCGTYAGRQVINVE